MGDMLLEVIVHGKLPLGLKLVYLCLDILLDKSMVNWKFYGEEC